MRQVALALCNNTERSGMMAPAKPQTQKELDASTRPRLQAINQDFSGLDEQIRQAAHIIGLPEAWYAIKEKEARTDIIKHLVRARAEWVLRWILDKLKEETDAGRAARANASAWLLLEWMVEVLPVSRSASHLRDASLPTILERTLFEVFGAHSAAHVEDVDMQDVSDSSNTMRGDSSSPSRKRKRGANGTVSATSGASKNDRLGYLFHAVRSLLQSLALLTATTEQNSDITQAELMKTVLRTDSAQASRILSFWFGAVHHLIESSTHLTADPGSLHETLDLTLVADIWDLRTIGVSDEGGSSADEFNVECLVPALQLSGMLRGQRLSASEPTVQNVLDSASQTLDKLLARHLVAPSRVAFFAATDSTNAAPVSQEATALSGFLAPLRAKLLQATQIQDAGENLPADFSGLFNAVAHLLDLAIRASPSRTPKGRLVEKPWIQAAFSDLADCVGCSLAAPPDFLTQAPAAAALVQLVQVLKVHNINLKPELLKKLFWYYCGVKYPERQEKQIHWALIGALIELDASVFAAEPKSVPKISQDHSSDLTEFIFEKISITELHEPGDDSQFYGAEIKISHHRRMTINDIVIPIMSAFTRNRNLLGFIRRWDHQLAKSYRHDYRKALKGRSLFWEDQAISQALAGVFESALTHGQIADLLEEHGKRLFELGSALETAAKESVKVKKLAAYKQASSSAVIVSAVLPSLQFSETLEACKAQLLSLLQTYTLWVQDDRYSFHMRLDSSWTTLCQLLTHLWPIALHGSQVLQQDILLCMEQAANDIVTASKKETARDLTSHTPAAAIQFLSESCECLSTIPGSAEIVRRSAKKVAASLATHFSTPDGPTIFDIFCARFLPLIGALDTNDCTEVLFSLLSPLTRSATQQETRIFSTLSQSILVRGKDTLKEAYTGALLRTLQNESKQSCDLVTAALLQADPSAISRAAREKFLDRAVETINNVEGSTDGMIALMAHFMVVPNATAKISTNGKLLFDIAGQPSLRDADAPGTIVIFQQLVHSTLAHIIPNHSQPQAMTFITQFSSKIDNIVKSPAKCTPLKLSILRAAAPFQDTTTLLKLKPYVELLKACLLSENENTAPLEDVLEAFNDIPLAAMDKANITTSTQAWLRTWVNDNSALESYLSSTGPSSIEVAAYTARLQRMIAKYNLYINVGWLVNLTIKVLSEPLADDIKDRAYDALRETLSPLAVYEKLDLVSLLTNSALSTSKTAAYRILDVVVTTLGDKLEANLEIKQTQLALLPRIVAQLVECSDYESFHALLSCVNNVLDNKPTLSSQHSIESVLSMLLKAASRSSPSLSSEHASEIFAHLCETTRLILLLHRGRLGGRFHIVIPLLQNLLFCLFVPNTSRSGALPFWLRSAGTEPVRLTSANATQFTRLLSTLCNPPQSSITKAHQHRTAGRSKDLNDPVKAAREKASVFLYPLLASYCRFTLSGRLDAGVREQLMPGIWEVVSTASLHKENLDAMFAGLGRSERDVWRGIWSEWERLYGRKNVLPLE